MTDSPVWDWLLGLCPLAKENGGNPERRSSEGCSVKEGAVRGHSCVEVLVTLGFKQRALQSEESLWPNVRTKSAHIVSWFM